jgi:carboxylesterase type B
MAHVVHTSSGRICGVPEEEVLVFRSIPYAQPPNGSRPLFNGVRLAARGDVVVVTLN